MLPSGYVVKIPLNIKLFLLPGHFEVLMLVDEMVKKGLTILDNSTFHEKLWLVLDNGDRNEYV